MKLIGDKKMHLKGEKRFIINIFLKNFKYFNIIILNNSYHLFNWNLKILKIRGPIIATCLNFNQRNAIGSHSGPYAIYRALAVAAG